MATMTPIAPAPRRAGAPPPSKSSRDLVAELKDLLYKEEESFTNNFPPEYEKKIRDNFRLFDRDRDSFLNRDQVESLLISIDVNLDTKDIDILYSSLCEENKGIVEDDFFLFVMKKIREEDKESHLLAQFKVIDLEGKGALTDIEFFKDLLMTKGLKMTEADADELLSAMKVKEGEPIDYSVFCKLLAGKDEGKKKKKPRS